MIGNSHKLLFSYTYCLRPVLLFFLFYFVCVEEAIFHFCFGNNGVFWIRVQLKIDQQVFPTLCLSSWYRKIELIPFRWSVGDTKIWYRLIIHSIKIVSSRIFAHNPPSKESIYAIVYSYIETTMDLINNVHSWYWEEKSV